MKIYLRHALLVALLLLCGCVKGPAEKAGSEAVIHIKASVATMTEVTKGPKWGEGWDVTDDPYGIFVCNHNEYVQRGEYVPHKANSWNIKAALEDFDNPTWHYYYIGSLYDGSLSSSPADNLTITEQEHESTADLYAYSPYTKAAYASGPTAIPFSVLPDTYGSTHDLMYAVENLTNSNSNLDPTSGDELDASFHFRHAYSLLRFTFKLVNGISRYSLGGVTVRVNDPDEDGTTTAKIYTSGTFNAISGEFNDDLVEVPSRWVAMSEQIYSTIREDTPEAGYMMLVPTQVEDDELSFSFRISGQTLPPFYLKKEQVRHGLTSTYGFLPGYMYTFNFTLDNYVYLDGIDISTGWTTNVLGSEEI